MTAIKPDAKISVPREVDLSKRPVVQTSMGPVLIGAALPHPDPQEPLTMIAGVEKRFAIDPPPNDDKMLDRLGDFVTKWVSLHLTPLSPTSDTSQETWYASTMYPLWRKQELREAYADMDPRKLDQYLFNNSFQKDEVYPEYKYPRAINSRSDKYKTIVGPIFKLIEKELFKLPWFIKKIPVKDRPKYLFEHLYRDGAKYYATDYTAFEANFRKKVMEKCEMILYRYMTQYLPEGSEWMVHVERGLLGRNHCRFKNFFVDVDATRMSGEMCTSLGNSFSNLMFMLFMCHEKGMDIEKIAGAVEGDDGLFVGEGEFPNEQDFAKLGLMLKMEEHEDLSTASFCGMVFDVEDLVNVTDPYEVLATFGWTSGRYARSKKAKLLTLLRAKSLSLAYQYPGCPILAELARYGMRMTRSYDVRSLLEKDRTMSMWDREQLLEALQHPILNTPVSMRTRLLVERKYGITVETQLRLEEVLRNKNDLDPIHHALTELHPDWLDYWTTYVHEGFTKDIYLEYPAFEPRFLGYPKGLFQFGN